MAQEQRSEQLRAAGDKLAQLEAQVERVSPEDLIGIIRAALCLVKPVRKFIEDGAKPKDIPELIEEILDCVADL